MHAAVPDGVDGAALDLAAAVLLQRERVTRHRVLLDDEQRQPAVPGGPIGIGAREQHDELGPPGEGGPGLHTVDAEPAVDRGGHRVDAGDVGTEVGLGHAHAHEELAGGDAGEPPLLLRLGAAGDDRAGQDLGTRDQRPADAERAPRQLLGGDHHREVVGLPAAREAAVLLGDRQTEPAELGESRHHVLGDVGVRTVHVLGDGPDLVGGEPAERVGGELELVGEVAGPGSRLWQGGRDGFEELG